MLKFSYRRETIIESSVTVASDKLSSFRVHYCPSIIGVQILCLNAPQKRFSVIFTMKLAIRQRTAVFHLEDAIYAVLSDNYLVTCVPYQ
jgi:hypothetical protein